MRKSYRNDNGEKIFRYSIRKYHFGAASVAVAALMFFANGTVQAQTPEISPATESGTTKTSALVSDSSGGVSKEISEESPATAPSEPSNLAKVIKSFKKHQMKTSLWQKLARKVREKNKLKSSIRGRSKTTSLTMTLFHLAMMRMRMT